MPTEEELIKNLKRCPYFESCSQNLCPLDFELHLRTGGDGEKCRWMREARQTKIKDYKFITGGSIMPDAILKFVPEDNVKWLNKASQKRWYELKNKVR